MNSNKEEPIYRVIFNQQDKQYEIYVKYISEETLMGFIEVEELIFSESKSNLVVDPSEEKLKVEFKGVKRSYIPLYSIVRIDEVESFGVVKIKPIKEQGNVRNFPGSSIIQRVDKEK
jgi:hypothetical protein